MEKHKVIGIPGYRNSNRDSFGAGITYLEYISKFGVPRIIMPWEDVVDVDLLILPGGLDVNPSDYDEVPSFKTSDQDVFKQHFYKNKLDAYINNDTPIFGICLGFQMLAVKFGAKLTQHLFTHRNSPDRGETAHKVYTVKGIDMYNSTQYKSMDVNGHHHQALCTNSLTKDIIQLFTTENSDDDAISNNGQIIEAFTIHNKPIVGVQWHPEEYYDKFSTGVINSLLNL